MNPVSINERVERIRNNDDEINRLVEEYKPFIASCVEKAIGRYVRYGEDDELSIGLMAFVEAIKSHDGKKGSFLSFAQNVIKRRLIDYYRKEKKHNNVVSIQEFYNEDHDGEIDFGTDEALESYARAELSEYRRLELQELKKELDEWDISFSQLARESPKHDKTRKLCREITGYILGNPQLVRQMLQKRYLPVAEIEKNLDISRKKIERVRKYIITVIIIAVGDYQYIRDFVDWG